MRQFVENSPFPFDKSTWRETARYFLTNLSSALPLDDGRRRDYQRVDDELEAMRSARPSSRRPPSPSSSHATGNKTRLSSESFPPSHWVGALYNSLMRLHLWNEFLLPFGAVAPCLKYLASFLLAGRNGSLLDITGNKSKTIIINKSHKWRSNKRTVSHPWMWWLSDIIPMLLLVEVVLLVVGRHEHVVGIARKVNDKMCVRDDQYFHIFRADFGSTFSCIIGE